MMLVYLLSGSVFIININNLVVDKVWCGSW